MTICIQNREKLFWKNEIYRADTGVRPYKNSENLNEIGKMVLKIWNEIPNKYFGIEIDEYIIMPDHIHGILIQKGRTRGSAPTIKNGNVGVDPCVDPDRKNKLGMIIKNFKTLTTKIFINNVKENGWPRFDKRLWQRDFYERIIRNEKEYLRIKEYIRNNPKYIGGLVDLREE